MRVGNRHRRILILGVGFERLAGDLAAQILGNRNAQYAGERESLILLKVLLLRRVFSAELS